MDNTQEQPHILSYKTLFGVLALLMILTAVTIGISTIDLGKWNVWIALFVASLKCTLVILFFMHLKYENLAVKWSFAATLCFLSIMIGFVFWDTAFR